MIASQQILVVEDNPDVRDFLVAALSAGGFDVTEAEDGAAALMRLAYPPPALVLLDVQMPLLSGLDVLRRFRATPAWADTPVVMLTASDQSSDLIEARNGGANGYLTKPIRSGDLVVRLRRIIDDEDLLWLDDVTTVRAR